MSKKRALQLILAVALFGAAFSGTLTYREVFAAPSAATCTALGAPGTVLGYPACVYGLIMYLAVAIIAAAGLLHREGGIQVRRVIQGRA